MRHASESGRRSTAVADPCSSVSPHWLLLTLQRRDPHPRAVSGTGPCPVRNRATQEGSGGRASKASSVPRPLPSAGLTASGHQTSEESLAPPVTGVSPCQAGRWPAAPPWPAHDSRAVCGPAVGLAGAVSPLDCSLPPDTALLVPFCRRSQMNAPHPTAGPQIRPQGAHPVHGPGGPARNRRHTGTGAAQCRVTGQPSPQPLHQRQTCA